MTLTELPVHPTTGLRALGMSKRGPIWPAIGGSVDEGAPTGQEGTGGQEGEAKPEGGEPKPDGAKPEAEVDWKAKYEATLAEARKHEGRAKDNKAAADELAKLKQSQMSDQEKAQAASKAATDRAEIAERRAALLEAAVEHSLTKDDLALLEDVPADKVAERAKVLAARLKAAAPAGASGGEVGGGKSDRKPADLTGALAAHLSK